MANWIEVALRSIVALLILVGVSRLFVRKPIGETTHLEFGIIAATAIILGIGSFQPSIPISYIVMSLLIWVGGAFLISLLSLKSKTFRSVIFGKGVPLIKDGKVLEDNLKKEQMTTDELLRKLRTKQVFQMTDVEFAVLEANGELNVLLKKEEQPLTAKLLNMNVAPIKEPETVMMDGRILDEPLATRGLSRSWLKEELAKIEVIPENVYLAQVDEYGQLTVDLFDDQLQVPKPTELPLLNASLKKVQADLHLYALDTENKQAQKMYQWCATQMQEVAERVSIYIK